jgi:signal transduction histidine kinase
MTQAQRICFVAAIICCVAESLACPTALAVEPKQVMLLHSFGRDFKPWSEYARTIRIELNRQSPWPLDITEHSLVTARSPDEDPEVPFVEYLRALSAKRSPDIIVSIGAPAAEFVQRHRRQLFANTPMVFTAVEQRRVQFSSLTENDAVVAVRINYLAAFENILQVLPNTKDVVVVVGASPIERFWKEAIAKDVEPLANRVKLSWTDDLSFEALLKHASALPPQSAIFWELMIVDAAGVVHEGVTPLTRLHAVANAPIFSYDESFFGNEIVGGPLLLVADSSRRTAAVAIRILSGEKPSEIKTPVVQFASPIFDWRQMQRWNIAESRLPPGSEIHFRPSSAWEQYRWQLSITFAIVLFQAALIAWLLFEHQRRHRAELESKGRLLEVIHLNRIASAGVLSASFSHDLNQPLGAIFSNAEAAEMLLKAEPPDVKQLTEILADIRRDDQRAAEIIHHLGGLLKKNSPVELQEFDLSDAVRGAASLLGHEALSRDIVLDVSQAQAVLPVRADAVHLQQVILNLGLNAMDAMLNCVPGSRKTIKLETMLVGHEVEVSVYDTGPGIPNDKLKIVFDTFYTTKPHGTGLGLSIARTIIENHGGKIWAENRLGEGAVFRFTLPLARVQ